MRSLGKGPRRVELGRMEAAMRANTFPDLLGLLYDGVLDPGRWNDFVAEVKKQFECTKASISLHDPGNQTPAVPFSAGLSPDELEEFTKDFGRINPRAPEVIRTVARTGSYFATSSLSYIPVRFRGSEYVTWLRRSDVYHSMLAGVPCGPGIASLNLVRSQSAEPFDTTAQKLVCELMPHLRRALQIHIRNETLGALFEAEKIALDSLDAAVVALDEEGRILMASGPAEQVLAKNKGVGAHRGKLKATHSSEAGRLEELVCSAAMTARGLGSGADGALTIHRETGSAPVSVVVTPLGLNCTLGQGRPCALAFFYDPDAKTASRATALRTLYSLTPAECRLADLLHAGLELQAAAQQIGVTTGTARFMLKEIFSKTGLHRQAQLVQLLNRLPSEPAASETLAGGNRTPKTT